MNKSLSSVTAYYFLKEMVEKAPDSHTNQSKNNLDK